MRLNIDYTTYFILRRSATLGSSIPKASDIPIGKEVDLPKGATIFFNSRSKDKKTSTTLSATFSGSSHLYILGSCEVIPLGQSPILQILHLSDSEPRHPAAACIMYLPTWTPLAPSMISAAALAARFPFLP